MDAFADRHLPRPSAGGGRHPRRDPVQHAGRWRGRPSVPGREEGGLPGRRGQRGRAEERRRLGDAAAAGARRL